MRNQGRNVKLEQKREPGIEISTGMRSVEP